MRPALAPAVLAVVAALAGCGGPTDHTAADVDFARTMIRYHDQAVAAARTATDRSADPAVRQIARTIRESYDPQVDELIGMLRAWDALEPDDPRGPDVGDAPAITSPPLPGMLSAEQIGELDRADGAAFDALFLRSMISHHDGSLGVGRAELTGGTNPAARALSRRILDLEGNTLAAMRQMYNQR